MKKLKTVGIFIVVILAGAALYNLFGGNYSQQQASSPQSTTGVDLDSAELDHQDVVSNTTSGTQPSYGNNMSFQQPHQSSFGSTILNYMLISSLMSNRFNTNHNSVNYPRYNQNTTTNTNRAKQSNSKNFSEKIIKNSKQETAQKSKSSTSSKSYKTDTKSYKQPTKSYKSNPKSYKAPTIRSRR
ncbi:hypothetical protein [Holzapfeliella sp. JNUCC 80]